MWIRETGFEVIAIDQGRRERQRQRRCCSTTTNIKCAYFICVIFLTHSRVLNGQSFAFARIMYLRKPIGQRAFFLFALLIVVVKPAILFHCNNPTASELWSNAEIFAYHMKCIRTEASHFECLNQKYQRNKRKWKFIRLIRFSCAIFHFLFLFAASVRRQRTDMACKKKTWIDHMQHNIRSDIDTDPSILRFTIGNWASAARARQEAKQNREI